MGRRSISVATVLVGFTVATMAPAAMAAERKKPAAAAPAAPAVASPAGLLVPIALENAANFRVAGKIFAAGAWPPANTTIDDIPFQPIKSDRDALDISTSMSGFKGGKIKNAYLSPDAGTGAKAKGPPKEMYGRLLLKVPADTYSAIHVLAFSQEKEGTVPRMTVRIGRFGNAAAILADSVAQVPSIAGGEAAKGGDATVISRIPVKLASGRDGFLYHVRISTAHTAELRELAGDDARNRVFDLEFTRDLNTHVPVPDPAEFTQVPAGQPSGVVVLAATLERSPIDMRYTTPEAGNVFHEEQEVVFNVSLANRAERQVSGRLLIEYTMPRTDPNAITVGGKVATNFTLKPGGNQDVPMRVQAQERGCYPCSVLVEMDGRVVQRRDTSFAYLAPDTRKDFAESPFGVWCFWTAHNCTQDPNRNDKLASLMQKGGWRWTYGGHPAAAGAGGKRGAGGEAADAEIKRIRDKYHVTLTVQSPPNAYERGAGWWNPAGFEKDVVPWLKHAHEAGFDNAFKVLHESRSSSTLLLRLSEFLGGQPYDMPPEEKEKLDKQFEAVKQYCLAIKKADPQAKIVLINDQPPVAVEYMKRHFPPETFDVFGSEGANFMREPERQPDWLSLLGTLQQLKRAQKQYGYDKPVWFTEALYHGTNPGNLSLHQQGVIAVREAMLALANGVERMTSAGLIADSADDYHWSNWGACGFCFRDPEYNPKPSYAMYAWLTQVLDGTKYAGKMSAEKWNDSTSLHVLDFKQRSGDEHVYPIWTVRGQQKVILRVASGTPKVLDCYGNTLAAKVQENRLEVTASSAPIYIVNATIGNVIERSPLDDSEKPDGRTLLKLIDSAVVKPVEGSSATLEGNWNQPRLRGKFTLEPPTDATDLGMGVTLKEDADPRKLLPRYVELRLAELIELPRDATALTAHVKGNGGWGRIIFECVDAKGRIWTSCGNQHPSAANAVDTHGDSFISFDGWGTIRQPLPGQYPGKDQQVLWPRNSEWWPTNLPTTRPAAAPATRPVTGGKRGISPDLPRGDEPVDLPLKLTKIIVEMRPHVLYVDEERPVAKPEIRIDAIGVEVQNPSAAR